jgi:rhodanese-related sulfurtransferase
VDKGAPVLFICRSGGRSHNAAMLALQAGFSECYNVLEGFEGDRDAEGHRSTKGGWRAAGLPWTQS